MKTAKSTKQTTYRMTCALMCALAMTTVSCSQEEPNAPEGNKKRITVSATIQEDGLETRVLHSRNGWLSWIETDKIGVWALNKEESYATFGKIGGGDYNAEFAGEISCEEGDALCAVYPNQPMKDGVIHFNLGNQPDYHNAPDIPQYMYATGTLKDNVVNLPFQHLVAAMEVYSIYNSGLNRETTSLTLSADGLHTGATLKMTSEGPLFTLNGDGKSRQSINIKPWRVDPALLHLFADDLKNIEIVVTDGTLTYKATLPDKKLEAGKMYNTQGVLTFIKQ